MWGARLTQRTIASVMGLLESALVAIALIASIVYLYFESVFQYWKNRGVPHEQPIIPYGNSKGISKTIHIADFEKSLYDKFKKEAPFFGIYMLTRRIAVITDLELMRNILIKDFNNFTDKGLYYNEKDDPLSAHLFSLDGAQWRFMRTKLSPTFTSGKMKFMFPTVLQVGHELENLVMDLIKKDSVIEIRELVARFTTDVIGTCAFGIECNSLKTPDAEFRVMGRNVFTKPKNGLISRVFLQSYPNLARKLRMTSTKENISKFFLGVVEETVKFREQNSIQRNDFMDLLLALKQNDKNCSGLTFGQLAAQAFVFWIAGFETSSTAISYCLYELAMNPDIQDKLREEIKRVLQKHDDKFTYEVTTEMTYLDQVINEILRKYPPVPLLFRKALNNYPVFGTQFVIEKDTPIHIPVYAIHYDPDIYPNPERFDPNRFSAEECKTRPPCTFLPFGDGPRNCIGLRFGRMQARVGLVMLLKNFKFSVCPSTAIPIKFDPTNFILMSKSGINLKVQKL